MHDEDTMRDGADPGRVRPSVAPRGIFTTTRRTSILRRWRKLSISHVKFLQR